MTVHEARLNRLRSLAEERGLDVILVSHPANRFYLTGYTADDVAPNSIAGALLVWPTSSLLMTSAVNLPWARAEAPETVEVSAWKRPFPSFLAETVKERGWKRIGFEDDAILFSYYRALTDTLGDAAELVPLGDAIDRLRRIKDAAEQEILTRAIAIGDAAFVDATKNLQPGVTEKQLASKIEESLRANGADGLSFHTIVAAGPHAARPHHAPTDRPLAEGEPIIIDMGALVAGYHGDLTRTIWLGTPSAQLRELYDVVLRMQEASFAKIRAGAETKYADIAPREVAKAAGFGEYLVHGVGHGIGVRIHEGPSTAENSDDVYQVGEITTVEPGLYIPDWGGVRIEDVVLVEENGYRNLTTAPK